MHIEISNEARITGSPDLKSLARLLLTVPKFAISQSDANSTVLISYDIKSLTWFCYRNAKFWAEFGSFGLAFPYDAFTYINASRL